MNDKQYIRTKVQKSLRNLLDKPHLSGHELSRFQVLSSLVSAILITGRSELSRLSLGNPDRKQQASKIKQYKRWLLNPQTGYTTHYLPYVQALLAHLAQRGELVFSIDGSVVGKGCLCLLFSVIYQGKAIPVVWKSYKAPKGHLSEDKHRALLHSLVAALSAVVPPDCKVVITGDGEFDGCDWQADIVALGWDYVLKTACNACFRNDDGDAFKAAHCLPCVGQTLFYEDVLFTQKRWRTNFLVWHGKGYQRPLYLVTNLDYPPLIQQYYKKRFKIEPFFRDQKSKGFHLHKSGLTDPARLDKLLVATCLAYILCLLAGQKAQHSKFYAEIARTDATLLSLFQLGYRFLLFLVDIRQWRNFNLAFDLKL